MATRDRPQQPASAVRTRDLSPLARPGDAHDACPTAAGSTPSRPPSERGTSCIPGRGAPRGSRLSTAGPEDGSRDRRPIQVAPRASPPWSGFVESFACIDRRVTRVPRHRRILAVCTAALPTRAREHGQLAPIGRHDRRDRARRDRDAPRSHGSSTPLRLFTVSIASSPRWQLRRRLVPWNDIDLEARDVDTRRSSAHLL
jgi:hypothetical protein